MSRKSMEQTMLYSLYKSYSKARMFLDKDNYFYVHKCQQLNLISFFPNSYDVNFRGGNIKIGKVSLMHSLLWQY